MKRFPCCILATCVVPWDERGQFMDDLFVDQVRRLLRLTPHLYIFGTAGEGYAVTEEQFRHIARLFADTMREAGAEPMVGVISASLPTIVQRIEWCRQMGVRQFQISLPCWGALTDRELPTFFRETCGRFTDCQFLHYNLLRAQRLITREYVCLADEHANLVATKNSSDSIDRLSHLIWDTPQLQHFITEPGYACASLLGECGLLASVSTLNVSACRELFAAGQRRDAGLLTMMVRELDELRRDRRDLLVSMGGDSYIDGAYDKMYWRMHQSQFPLRLLPPYAAISDEAFARFEELLRRKYPRWAPEQTS